MNNFNELKPQLLSIIEPILKESNLELYELNNVLDFETSVLQVLVVNFDKSNLTVDFDNLVAANEKISAALDRVADLSDAYVLEVASAGIERTIHSKAELIENVGNYLFFQINFKVEFVDEFNADLLEYDKIKDEFKIFFFLKGKKKNVWLKWEDIKFVRLAVKF
ncbi:ribosome maturation factor RimP [Spiroplasma sabaudiense Ar-1343]|uniref:Ribosome maturation factor RimP n=1 Tax=Spiroplasma sabaudiense Ar-1343 TaxID=1276257 RepID=W6AJS2_9MOLU|nr:ribosome assembly cofactor RimP [Spiroplasma sabaudiense]AHI53979.1 ribosome maturation factor RimP [Spiroplasma sabaudiense Ar-1343]